MSLSQENIDKLCMTGLYTMEPNKKYRGSLFWDDMYHCCNWYFKIHKWSDGRYFMRDTYWSDDSALLIELTDENINEFEFVFDFNEVKSVSDRNIYDYDECDRFHVALDSGGMYCGGKWFIRKNATKNREIVLERLQEDIKGKQNALDYAKRNYEMVLNGERNLEYV